MGVVHIRIDEKGIFVGANWKPIKEIKYAGTYLLKQDGEHENKLLLININTCNPGQDIVCDKCIINIVGSKNDRIPLQDVKLFDEFLDFSSYVSPFHYLV